MNDLELAINEDIADSARAFGSGFRKEGDETNSCT